MFTSNNCLVSPLCAPGNQFLIIKRVLLLTLFFIIKGGSVFSQTFPSPSSCTSKDLLLVKAELNNGDICGSCTPGTMITNRHLIGYINNKTGSTRTSFAFWGTLVLTNPDGSTVSRTISRCRGPIPKNAITPIDFDTIQYTCGQSLKIIDLYLAWTDAAPNSVCPLNSATINPKCGTLPSIIVVAGLNADISKTDATCSAGGSITVSPYGGTAPYSITVNGVTKTVTAAYGTATFTNLPASSTAYGISITDNTSPTHCVNNSNSRVINSPSGVTVNAGDDFKKTCTENPTGKQIGEAAEAGYTYSWSPASGLSDASASNPIANPTTTTTYTVTKTNAATNCSKTDDVVVTVDIAVPAANAGSDVTINCTAPTTTLSASGGVSYSWSPTTGLSNANISNPVASPSSTTTYVLTVTAANGCTATDDVKVTVDKTAPVANAGSDVTLTCTTTSTTLSASGGISYSWSPTTGLSNANISNPVASPSSTTTYVVTVTAANGCTATDDVKVTVNTTPPAAPAVGTITQPSCGESTGSITIQSPDANLLYSFDGGTFVAYPAGGYSAGVGDHTLRAQNSDGCISSETPVSINSAPATPIIASVCLVQPTLCANSGSVTINASGGSNLQYSIDGGNTWSSSNVFSSLGSGSVSGIKVMNDDGCANDVELTCADIVSDCGQELSTKNSSNKTMNTNSVTTVKKDNSKSFIAPAVKEGEINVRAYPNPFQQTINFWFVSPVNGRAVIEVFNIAGQRIGVAFDGNVKAGIANTLNFKAGNSTSGMLFYQLKVGDKAVRGKIQQIQ